ncbi:MAG: hypothetical protein JWN99_2912 [Ilumatobacteraceae bacterium]|nr:hypothetical protein [Ilumatobacteraceae bacterium]
MTDNDTPNEHRLAHDVVMPLGMSGDSVVFHEGSGDDDPPELVTGEPSHEHMSQHDDGHGHGHDHGHDHEAEPEHDHVDGS